VPVSAAAPVMDVVTEDMAGTSAFITEFAVTFVDAVVVVADRGDKCGDVDIAVEIDVAIAVPVLI
jgi:hypothetical protein